MYAMVLLSRPSLFVVFSIQTKHFLTFHRGCTDLFCCSCHISSTWSCFVSDVQLIVWHLIALLALYIGVVTYLDINSYRISKQILWLLYSSFLSLCLKYPLAMLQYLWKAFFKLHIGVVIFLCILVLLSISSVRVITRTCRSCMCTRMPTDVQRATCTTSNCTCRVCCYAWGFDDVIPGCHAYSSSHLNCAYHRVQLFNASMGQYGCSLTSHSHLHCLLHTQTKLPLPSHTSINVYMLSGSILSP